MSRVSTAPVVVRRDLVVVGLAAAILFLTALGARDLWNPNEPTYGRGVAEMAESGTWLMPTVNGLVFAEKPILYFWMARAASVLAAAFRAPLTASMLLFELTRDYDVVLPLVASAGVAALVVELYGERRDGG